MPGLALVQTVQHLGPAWEGVMRAFTFLGSEIFYLLAIPLIYWCLDGALGVRLGILLLGGASLNAVLKLAFHTPRPYWVSSQVQALSSGESFGLPSGHAQNALTLWGAGAAHLKRLWAWGGALLLAFGIGLSRLYLGVHAPQDVLLGWLIGAAVLWAALRLEGPLVRLWQSATVGQRRLGALIVSLGLVGLGVGARLAFAGSGVPPAWAQRALAATGVPITPWSLRGVVAPAGGLLGLLWGLAPQQALWNPPPGSVGGKAVRYLVGLLALAALYVGLRFLLPAGDDALGMVFRLLRYAVVGWWISAGAPALFRRFGVL